MNYKMVTNVGIEPASSGQLELGFTNHTTIDLVETHLFHCDDAVFAESVNGNFWSRAVCNIGFVADCANHRW